MSRSTSDRSFATITYLPLCIPAQSFRNARFGGRGGQPDDSWLLTEFSGLTHTFEYSTIPARVALADIYRGVTLPERPER